MRKKKLTKRHSEQLTENKPLTDGAANRIKIFKSFEEQEKYELEQMSLLRPEEILQQLRKFINIAYGMHGYNPDNLPLKHTIQIINK